MSDNRQPKEQETGKRSTHVLGRHSMQSFDFLFPVWSDALPGGHSLQSVALATPVADEYVPSGHPIHTLLATAPISVEYNPAGHSVVCFNIEDEENPINEFHTKSNHKTDQQITFHKNNINKT